MTAWARWSAARRGLDDQATARLTERLPDVLSRFDAAYDAEAAALARTYMADLATSFAAARLLFSDGLNRHDVIHALAERAASSADR